MKLFVLDLIAALAYSAGDLAYPLITRTMIGRYIPDKDLYRLILFGAVLLVIYLVKFGLQYFMEYMGHVVGVRMQADMRRDVFHHLQHLPVTYYDENKTGVIMSRITNDLFQVSELAHHGPEDLFISAVMLVGSFVVMSTISLPLTLIIFAGLPVMVIFAVKNRRSMSEAFSRSKIETGEVNASLENSISGIRVSKAYVNDEAEEERFSEDNGRYVRARQTAYKAMARFHSGMGLINDILLLMMYVAGGLFVYYEKVTVADFTAFVLYINLFMNPIKRLVSFMEQFQDGMTGFRRFEEIMDYPAESDSEGAVELPDGAGEIEFSHVAFSYDEKNPVLGDISFKVPAGKTLALVGPSGGGKTTICHLIPRFYEVTGGSVTVDGYDVRDVTLESLRRRIGLVSQDVFLFNDTLYENIACGKQGATRAEVEQAARLAGIHDYIMSMPDGYDTIAGERGVKLSGGQKQRISIARAFLKDPQILILDEATSALDNVTERLIQESLEKLSHGRTVIVVAHRLSTVRGADNILVIGDSGIIESGTHDQLMSHDGAYAALIRGTNVGGKL